MSSKYYDPPEYIKTALDKKIEALYPEMTARTRDLCVYPDYNEHNGIITASITFHIDRSFRASFTYKNGEWFMTNDWND